MADQELINAVRANLGDTDSVWFDDATLGSYLDTNGSSVARATGAAILNMSLVATMTGRSVKADDLALDSRQRGKDLREIAQSWFDQADAEDSGAASDVFDVIAFSGANRIRQEFGLCPDYRGTELSPGVYPDSIYPA
jgi:hypothetical protein